MAVMVRAYWCLGNEKKNHTVLDPVTEDKRSLARLSGRWEYKVKIHMY
jgi:hypothetical protein